MQLVLEVLPADEDLPAGQFAQTFTSVKVADGAPGRAYLPTGHVSERQGPPLPDE